MFLKSCKYSNCIKAIIFALFGVACIVWGFSMIHGNKAGYNIALPFVGILVCLFFSLRSIVHHNVEHKVTGDLYPFS